ncbi:helix-turn-helix transcriptional regulator [Roseomonas sp. OT10]|uniref:AraC family transcriptional regulator n=1 Tax=Roseomonas cutis TaxID=2897332 RepID=UPI001E4A48D8|nr:helix-turn-helix domain-containing protein [Roseomonas sp. OT10]UFN50506.1 helix-turn-helix transcriptional regulator [Roseomonas sp. OT10]
MAVAPLREGLPQDAVDRPLAGFARDYPDGAETGWHHHARVQLLYGLRGVMRIATAGASFVLPAGLALWVPGGTPHALRMQGEVAMRALFLRADAAGAGPQRPQVLGVSPLLRELILATCAEPVEWAERGRGPHLAALILDEIRHAPRLPFGLPEPRDPRLRRLAALLRERPGREEGLEEWSALVGASPRTLSRLFRRETGLSFAAWRQALRLTEAGALLAGGLPPARAAAAVGYASTAAFGAAFRAAFGMTPGMAARPPAPGR